MTDSRPLSPEPNVEAGDYIEDDPAAWEAFLEGARRYFTENLDHLRREFGDEGIGIAAGAMLSYLADQHGVYLGRPDTLAARASAEPEGLAAAWAAAEAALPEGWAINMLWGTVTEDRWAASAGPFPADETHTLLHRVAGGPTPAAALLALAERLSQEPDRG